MNIDIVSVIFGMAVLIAIGGVLACYACRMCPQCSKRMTWLSTKSSRGWDLNAKSVNPNRGKFVEQYSSCKLIHCFSCGYNGPHTTAKA